MYVCIYLLRLVILIKHMVLNILMVVLICRHNKHKIILKLYIYGLEFKTL